MTEYKVIKGNAILYIEQQLKWYKEKYNNFTIYGGISNYENNFSVLVSYDKTSPERPEEPENIVFSR